MKSIQKNINSSFIINKSKFITEMMPVTTKEEIEIILKDLKLKYKGATHYCYAYILENSQHFSDDGEPSGTAGIPILKVLEGNHMTNILCVVIRYFGGIKLGTGGLVRAYTKAVTSALEAANLYEVKEKYKVQITFAYESSKLIEKTLKDMDIIFKDFKENIEYIFFVECQKYKQIETILQPICLKLEILDKMIV